MGQYENVPTLASADNYISKVQLQKKKDKKKKNKELKKFRTKHKLKKDKKDKKDKKKKKKSKKYKKSIFDWSSASYSDSDYYHRRTDTASSGSWCTFFITLVFCG